MERRFRLGALTVCLAVVVFVAPVGGPQVVVSDVLPLVGAVLLLVYGVLVARGGTKDPIDAVRGLDPGERRGVRDAWRHPELVPHHLRTLAHAHAEARAHSDELLGWLSAAIGLWCLSATVQVPLGLGWRLVAGLAPVLAGFVADDLARRRRVGAIALADGLHTHRPQRRGPGPH